MYLWKIEELNEQLVKGTLPESESFKYLMASTVIYSLAMIQYMTPNNYDTLSGFITLAVSVVGLWFIYKCNGGANGKYLLQRYMSIGWVILVRFIVILLIPTVIVLILVQALVFGDVPEQTSLIDVVFMNVAEVVYILWVAKHINKVATQTSA